jgi:LmbE family N-acetylglucosaminyl deacetylase
MSTLVCFHAHPDDESISTGGLLARAAAEGHRTVLVVATDGRHGEAPDDLADGETLADRRKSETERSCAALGVHRLEWLGYRDSGMTGWEQNEDPESFWQATNEAAAERLASILGEEAADVLCVYDWHGVYGHPDHVKVHRVGVAAAALAGTPKVIEATMNRAMFAKMAELAPDALGPDNEDGFDPNAPADDGNPFGEPAENITLAVDVSAYVAQKRESMQCHRSQITDTSFFMQMPEAVFAMAFGTEWFIERGVPTGAGPQTGWIF